MGKELIIGTRGSKLALIQTELVVEALKKTIGVKIVPKTISTKGDQQQDLSLRRTTGEGVFVREIEAALLRGEIDLAVHSLKDLPVEETPGLKLQAFLKREDPREAFLASTNIQFADLADGAVIGTSSLRRIIQLQKIQPSYFYRDIRGNIDTRIRKMKEGSYEGIILAVAGLKRLQLTDNIRQIFNFSECLPAVGQGVIAIQMRQDFNNREVLLALDKLNDIQTELAVTAERSFLKQLGGGCRLPVGALATVTDNSILLFGMVADTTGEKLLKNRLAGGINTPDVIGKRLADWFLQKGIIDWN